MLLVELSNELNDEYQASKLLVQKHDEPQTELLMRREHVECIINQLFREIDRAGTIEYINKERLAGRKALI